MQSLFELTMDIKELESIVKMHDDWTEYPKCPTCMTPLYKSGWSRSMAHRQLHCGRSEKRLLEDKRNRLSQRIADKMRSKIE